MRVCATYEGSAELAIIRLRRTASTTIVYGAGGCWASQAVASAAGIGRAMKYPWAALQPRRVMSSSPASESTPSATVDIPSCEARLTLCSMMGVGA